MQQKRFLFYLQDESKETMKVRFLETQNELQELEAKAAKMAAIFYTESEAPIPYDEGELLTIMDNDEYRAKVQEPLVFRAEDVLATMSKQHFSPLKALIHRPKLELLKIPERDKADDFTHTSFSTSVINKATDQEGYVVKQEKGLTQCNIPPNDGTLLTLSLIHI